MCAALYIVVYSAPHRSCLARAIVIATIHVAAVTPLHLSWVYLASISRHYIDHYISNAYVTKSLIRSCFTMRSMRQPHAD